MNVYSTKIYEKWFFKLKDKVARAKIDTRIRRIKTNGNFGDCESVSQNVSELRIDYGPGYRIYITIKTDIVVILLVGGDKSSQRRDIKKAEKMAVSVMGEEMSEWF